MMPTETMVDTPKQKSSLLRTVKAVAWSFIGLRKGSEFEEDVKQLNPLHIVAVGIAGAVASLVSAVPGVPSWVAVAGGACALVGSGVAGLFGVHYAGVSR